MKGLLLYHRADYELNQFFANRLISSAKERGVTITLCYVEDFGIGIREGNCFLENGIVNLEDIDFVINRSREYRITYSLENLGIRVFNNGRVTMVGNDKWLSYMWAYKLGLPCVETYSTYHCGLNQLGYPYVLKSVNGYGGSDVYKVENEESAAGYDGSVGEWVVQKFIPNMSDARVFVLGGEIIGCVRRTPTRGFLSNYKQGGQIEWIEPSEQMSEYALKMARALESDYVGVDFLVGQNGLFFNELEDVVGCRSIYTLKNMDIALKYIEYILKIMYNRN